MEKISDFYTCGSEKPKKLVVLLHGLGANGQDLLGLGQVWAPHLPDVRFISPDAPYPCDMAPVGYQWFSLQDWSPNAIEGGSARVRPVLDSFLDAQLAQYNLTNADLILCGFSQGSMLSLFAGPRRAGKLGGILAYSGGLYKGEGFADVQKPPITIIHGDADTVVPPSFAETAETELKAAGFPVQSHILRGLGHGIDERGLTLGLAALKTI